MVVELQGPTLTIGNLAPGIELTRSSKLGDPVQFRAGV